MKKHLILIAMAAPWLAGCASAIDGSTQPITVATEPEPGADCTVSNALGQWTLTSPGTVIVKKSASVLSIHCSKPGWKDGTAYASGKISTASMVGMMLPYVGLLNAAVDGSTGAGQEYPRAYTITMKPAASASEPATGAIAPPPSANATSGAPQTH